MSNQPVHVLAVIGSLQQRAVTRVVTEHVAGLLREQGCVVDILDFAKEPLGLYNPDTSHDAPEYADLQKRVDRAEVIILATPDYHGSMSSALKNFLDHFWREFAGKMFATIVASHEKGLTVADQVRTVARQCYAWVLPYSISLSEGADVKDGQIVSEGFRERISMFAHDVRVYGGVLATQRRKDLAGKDPGFLARHRK